MSSSTTIGDPYLLAAYSLPPPSKKSLGKSVAPDERPFILSSHSTGSKHEDGLLTVAVQGDGIHVLDLSGLHPVSSHTLGPSTRFYSTPVTILSTEDDTSFRRTYVAIDSSNEIKGSETSKRVVWSWKEEVDGQIGTSQSKASTILPYDAAYIIPDSFSNSLFLITRNGRVMNTNFELTAPYNYTLVKDETQRVFKAFTFTNRNCDLGLAAGIPLGGTIIVLFILRGKELHVNVVGVNQEKNILHLDDMHISELNAEQLLDISCSSSGYVSVLERDASWHFFRLADTKEGVKCVPMGGNPLKLKGLNFSSEKSDNSQRQASILSLGSSFVLLAAITPKPEISLLLWDIQYGVLLTSSTLPVPSTLEKSPSSFSLKLVEGNSTQALLLLEPTSYKSRSENVRASILVVPFTTPPSSTIANALGKGANGAKWLEPVSLDETSILEDSKELMLSKLNDAIEEERVTDADKIFFDWVKANEVRTKGKGKAPASPIDATQDAETAEDDSTRLLNSTDNIDDTLFNHVFVTRILDIVLQPDLPSGKPYSPKICRYLVTKNYISYSMVKGGILSALQQHNDWETIRECFIRVIDIPENEALRLLGVVVKHHKNPKDMPKEKESMSVDEQKSKQKQKSLEQTSIPPIASFLAHIVEYPASPQAWRKAVQEYFADIDDLMIVLKIVEEWLRIHANKDLPLGFVDLKSNEHNVPVPVVSRSKKLERVKGVLLPSLDKLLTFTQSILDSSFLSLLQSPSTYETLRSISAIIAPLVSVNEDLEILRGPLAPFQKAQAKALLDVGSKKKRGEEVDWRKRRKQAMEQANLNLGPYQVEELVF